MIILDDNFSSVVKGVEHGRRCFINLKKVIIYLLPAGSWCEMLPVMTNVFLGMPLALSSFLMIVICCCTDVGLSLAMVYEKPESTIMSVPPRRIGQDHLVDWKLLLNAYLFIGMIEAAVAYGTFFLFYAAEDEGPGDILLKFTNGDEELMYQGQCLYFYALVVMQLGNVLTSRTARVPIWRQNPFAGPARNLRIFAAMVVSMTVLALMCYLPFIQQALNTRGLPVYWQPLLLPWGGALLLIALNEARKALGERFPRAPLACLMWG